MYIDIYRTIERRTITERLRSRYRAIPAGSDVPESWAGARHFKTLDLQPGTRLIGAGDTTTILANLAKEGWSDMDAGGGRIAPP